jgi:8-oxo-dGTP diphosphatase
MKNKPIEVAAAIFKTDKKVLIGKRMQGDSNGGKWEFPGGKIHEGESAENALRREIKEELGFELEGFVFFDQVQFDYPKYSVNIQFYLVDVNDEMEFVKNSHYEMLWINPQDSDHYEFLEANKIVLRKLADLFL